MNAKLIKHNGAMTISINGVLYPFVTFKLTEVNNDKLFIDTVRSEVPEMAKRGVHIYFVPVYFDWTGEGMYDFSYTDWRIKKVLQADTDGYVVIRIQASAMNPKWWLERNPDSIVKFGCGREPELPKSLYQTEPSPSLASNFWEEAGIPAILALATHVKQQQYSSRIIGYLPTAYNSNEWFFRTYDDLQVNDLCPIMQKAFNKYMQEKTGRDIVFSVPDRIHRGYADYGYFIHPDPIQAKFPVVEFYRFLNSLCTEKIIKITAALREIYAPDRIIIGTFYGYSLGLANAYWLADSGHLNLVRLLEEDGPDFTCSPLDYFVRNNRDLPSGGFCWAQGTQPDSAFIHNKAYFAEDDYRPYTNKRDGTNSWMKGPDNIEEDVEMLKRNFVFSLCKGQLQWWYDLGGHWYESKERLDAVEQCVKIANISLKRNRNQISQIAVVMDEKASWYLTLDRQMQWTIFWENFFCSFNGIGAPVDLLLLTDLQKSDISRYKCVFFPTCFALTASDREQIEMLKSNDRTLVFYQSDGLIYPGHKNVFSEDNISSLIGMKIKIAETGCRRITTGSGHHLLRGFENSSFGISTEKIMGFIIVDSQSEFLGYFGGSGPAGFAMKKHKNWTSIYCAVPVLPPTIVRNIINDAKIHIYSESDDIIYANYSYVGIFTRTSGNRTINLPSMKKVRECFTNKIIADKSVSCFNLDVKQYHTYLFELL